MRVLHTINSVREGHGGPSRSVPGLVRALNALPVEARLHVADRDGPIAADRIGDLVHDHGLWLPSNQRAARAARRARCPLIVSPRGMLEPWAMRHRQWKKRLAWPLYQRAIVESASVLHVTSTSEAGSVRDMGLTQPVAIVPNGIHLLDALPVRTTGERRRALFLSRLHPKKGAAMLIEAWARVRPAGWELVLAGPDEAEHATLLRAQVLADGLSDVVSFVGPVSDIDKWTLYRSADLFVLPTYSENFGLVVAEALAAGVPVITTTGAPWDVLAREQAGWWVAPEVDAITAALAEATSMERETLRAMGERGQRHALQSYGWPAVAGAMLDVYCWVLGKGDRPDSIR